MSSSQQLLLGEGAGGGAGAAVYIEDVFSTWLYTGTGSAQTITNGIDLSTKGGLVWSKARSTADSNYLCDTVRGRAYYLVTNTALAQDGPSNSSSDITSFNSTGYSLGPDSQANINTNAITFASWTFREQPKFFDIVTYSGSSSSQTISHNLGSAPGCIMIKKLDSNTFNAGWAVYHRSLTNPNNYYLVLNTTAAETNYGGSYISSVTSTTFTVAGGAGSISIAGSTYIAYIFAHDAGGFGAAGTDNVISCGKFEAGSNNPSGSATVTLGYEPQWILTKNATGTSTTAWQIYDNMRGVTALSPPSYPTSNALNPNTTGAEGSTGQYSFNATGFVNTGGYNNGDQIIYIAIRRGPMKVPTLGTSVFAPVAYTGNNSSTRQLTSGFPIDVIIGGDRSSPPTSVFDRLRGVSSASPVSATASTADEQSSVYGILGMTTLQTGDGTVRYQNSAGVEYIDYFLRRAPSYLDEICYTGTGVSGLVLSHNLTVVPEFTLIKERTNDGIANWAANYNFTSTTYVRDILNRVDSVPAVDNYGSGGNNYAAAPTATTITVGTSLTNANGSTYVAYLFATCAGVSKVGNFTGNGSTQTINCGFGAGGARFVLIKRTDDMGNWYVYDTARGMTVLTNPYLRFNSTSAEVATLGSVTTVSTGFALNAAVLADININAATYIFLAIA